jgi:hypothetical protein
MLPVEATILCISFGLALYKAGKQSISVFGSSFFLTVWPSFVLLPLTLSC